MKTARVLLLPTFAVTLLEAQQDLCILGESAQASVLMQRRGERAPPLPLGPEEGALHDDAHRWADRLSALASHAAGARRRRGTNKYDGHASSGFKVASEQTESVHDGLFTFKAADKNMVDTTMREMVSMKDMQKVVVAIVAGLLFANMLAILSVCMCQVYAQNHKAPDEPEQEPVVLGPGARLGMIIEALAKRPGMLSRLNGAEVIPVKRAGPLPPRSEGFNLTPECTSTTPCTPAPIPGGSSPRSNKIQKTGDEANAEWTDYVRKDDLEQILAPTGSMIGGSGRVSAVQPRGNKSNKILDPMRTVDAFCTPGRRPSGT